MAFSHHRDNVSKVGSGCRGLQRAELALGIAPISSVLEATRSPAEHLYRVLHTLVGFLAGVGFLVGEGIFSCTAHDAEFIASCSK